MKPPTSLFRTISSQVINAITQLQGQRRVRAVRTRRQYLRVGSMAPSVAPTVLPARTRPVDRSAS
jgi:hypothetical protein